jgi:hypothetical protein
MGCWVYRWNFRMATKRKLNKTHPHHSIETSGLRIQHRQSSLGMRAYTQAVHVLTNTKRDWADRKAAYLLTTLPLMAYR